MRRAACLPAVLGLPPACLPVLPACLPVFGLLEAVTGVLCACGPPSYSPSFCIGSSPTFT